MELPTSFGPLCEGPLPRPHRLCDEAAKADKKMRKVGEAMLGRPGDPLPQGSKGCEAVGHRLAPCIHQMGNRMD